uniref:Uncharacterized protein n=1 Tax=Setaria italica TaxID=4555 RepID=K3Z0U9_SETIT
MRSRGAEDNGGGGAAGRPAGRPPRSPPHPVSHPQLSESFTASMFSRSGSIDVSRKSVVRIPLQGTCFTFHSTRNRSGGERLKSAEMRSGLVAREDSTVNVLIVYKHFQQNCKANSCEVISVLSKLPPFTF